MSASHVCGETVGISSGDPKALINLLSPKWFVHVTVQQRKEHTGVICSHSAASESSPDPGTESANVVNYWPVSG